MQRTEFTVLCTAGKSSRPPLILSCRAFFTGRVEAGAAGAGAGAGAVSGARAGRAEERPPHAQTGRLVKVTLFVLVATAAGLGLLQREFSTLSRMTVLFRIHTGTGRSMKALHGSTIPCVVPHYHTGAHSSAVLYDCTLSCAVKYLTPTPTGQTVLPCTFLACIAAIQSW